MSLLILVAAPLQGADRQQGKRLHDHACTRCHGPEIYTRDSRRIHTRPQLERQVELCAQNAAKVAWSDEQKTAVADYLDHAFYRFGDER